MSEQHGNVFGILDDNAHSLVIHDLPSDYMAPNNVDDSIFDWGETVYQYVTRDGMLLGIPRWEFSYNPWENCGNSRSYDNRGFSIVVDVNGAKKPNTASKDLHKYRLCWAGLNSPFTLENVDDELIPDNSRCSADMYSNCQSKKACQNVGGRWVDRGYDKRCLQP